MKMKTIKQTSMLLTFFLLLVVALGFKDCKKKGGGGGLPTDDFAIKTVAKSPNGAIILARDVFQRTDKGAGVFGKVALTPAQLSLIDLGLAETLDNLKAEGFPVEITQSLFEIYTPPYECRPSPVAKVPAFLVRADNYDGSEFDVYPKAGVGVIYAVELVFNLGTPNSIPPIPQMYICPDISGVQINAKHGSEHQVLARFPYNKEMFPNIKHADVWNYFNCSITHSEFGHPLLPRNDRCAGEKAVSETEQLTAGNMPERELTDTEKQDLKAFNLSGKERIANALIIKPVK